MLSFTYKEIIMETLNTAHPVIEQCNHIPQLLNIKDVGSYTGLSRSTIYEMVNEKSDRYDPTFPKKVQLTQVRVVWVASEIAEWINNKIAKRST
ncbi:possible prophage regulatory protein AlpA [Psychrobacter arcticus 273-4]|uniref:Possible prophage regulatory protein AlpA n=2 Tax=Psychrobacter arcticus TaxID=334543 RepID=Q4FTD7_PSYA2|nr:possible prophage regulatory protein AlpA [Psychrobacter arcticus 273-4]